MRFDLGTLDSGERSLPFGLLVFYLDSNTTSKCAVELEEWLTVNIRSYLWLYTEKCITIQFVWIYFIWPMWYFQSRIARQSDSHFCKHWHHFIYDLFSFKMTRPIFYIHTNITGLSLIFKQRQRRIGWLCFGRKNSQWYVGEYFLGFLTRWVHVSFLCIKHYLTQPFFLVFDTWHKMVLNVRTKL